jgi:alkylhydroperoxidase family enzyme
VVRPRELWPALEAMLPEIARLSALDPFTTELVRLRGARAHNCRMCKSLRNVRAVESGGDEATFDKIDLYERSDLAERHKVALRLADAMLWTPARIPGRPRRLGARALHAASSSSSSCSTSRATR